MPAALSLLPTPVGGPSSQIKGCLMPKLALTKSSNGKFAPMLIFFD